MSKPSISILIATYNGERFIKEQLDSLLSQTYQDFIIYISDDNSSDATYSIVQDYTAKYPDKIFISQNDTNSGSAKLNFIQMMLKHKNDYIMLCDQDDVWLPDKIEKSFNKIREMEAQFGTSTSLLVHTDLTVTDEALNVLHPSFFKLEDVNTENKSLNKIVARCILTGCTAIYNRALADLIKTAPEFFVMHDWWLVLSASAFGKIETLHESTILYRQHSDNEIGVINVKTLSHIIHKLTHFHDAKKVLKDTYKQAECFLDTFYDILSPDQIDFLVQFCDIPNHNKIIR